MTPWREGIRLAGPLSRLIHDWPMADLGSGMRDDIRRLIVPAIRASEASSWPAAEAEARAGFGGFLLFGGERRSLPGRIAALRRAAGGRGLLVYSDLERGAGQQVEGLTRLSHLMAIGATRDADLAERAGLATAREARAVGIDAIFAPCVDLNTDPENPIINVRAFGDDPEAVARLGAAWAHGAARGGALACAKHFPGHGHVRVDSHIALPRLDADLATLERRELVPFRALARAGVATVMTAHMAVPALTGEADLPVTLSARAIRYLRETLGFEGLVVTDALLMGGITGAFDEGEAAVRALAAGCDVLLCPSDPEAIAGQLAQAVASGRVPPGRVREAAARLDRAIARVGEAGPPLAGPDPEARALAEEIGARALAVLSGAPPGRVETIVLLSGDEGEAGGELAAAALRIAPEVRLLPVGPDSPEDRVAEIEARAAGSGTVVAVFSRIAAWKGAAGLWPREARLLETLAASGAAVVSLGSPYLLQAARGACFRACAFSDEPPSQRAVAAAIFGRAAWPGAFPVRL